MKLVLKKNLYYIESRQSEVVQKLLKDPVISTCLLTGEAETTQTADVAQKTQAIRFPIMNREELQSKVDGEERAEEQIPEDIDEFYERMVGEEDDDAEAIKNLEVLAFEVKPDCIEPVQKR